MNDEKLIELVRQNTSLYDIEDSKYSDNYYKEKIWSEIAKKLNVAKGSNCKCRWNQLRDQWRKHKKNKVWKSGQGYKLLKKWRYEEEMEFLEPFTRQREFGNIDDVNLQGEETERQENSNDVDTKDNVSITETEEHMAVAINNYIDTLSMPTPKQHLNQQVKEEPDESVYKRQRISSHFNQPLKEETDEPHSPLLMRYLLEKRKEELPATKDPTDTLFESIAGKLKSFTPYHRNIAESRIFNLVQELELEQILQTKHRLNIPSPAPSHSIASSLVATVYEDTNVENND